MANANPNFNLAPTALSGVTEEDLPQLRQARINTFLDLFQRFENFGRDANEFTNFLQSISLTHPLAVTCAVRSIAASIDFDVVCPEGNPNPPEAVSPQRQRQNITDPSSRPSPSPPRYRSTRAGAGARKKDLFGPENLGERIEKVLPHAGEEAQRCFARRGIITLHELLNKFWEFQDTNESFEDWVKATGVKNYRRVAELMQWLDRQVSVANAGRLPERLGSRTNKELNFGPSKLNCGIAEAVPWAGPEAEKRVAREGVKTVKDLLEKYQQCEDEDEFRDWLHRLGVKNYKKVCDCMVGLSRSLRERHQEASGEMEVNDRDEKRRPDRVTQKGIQLGPHQMDCRAEDVVPGLGPKGGQALRQTSVFTLRELV